MDLHVDSVYSKRDQWSGEGWSPPNPTGKAGGVKGETLELY